MNGTTIDDIFAGTTGTPITFPAAEWSCVRGDPNATETWDFGDGATPATVTTTGVYDGVIAVHFPPVAVTYSTTGDKTITVTIFSNGKISTQIPGAVHIYDCSMPSIPHDAVVVKSDTTVRVSLPGPPQTYWVNPGVTLHFESTQHSVFTIFAEPGSTISGSIENCRPYMKHGSVLARSSGTYNSIIEDGASTNATSQDFTLNCPTLNFDYTNAPPNVAFQDSVTQDLNAASIQLFPNPTNGMLRIEGLPSSGVAVAVFNVLGERVLNQQKPSTPECTLDLSALPQATYYVRVTTGSSVVTKAIVKR